MKSPSRVILIAEGDAAKARQMALMVEEMGYEVAAINSSALDALRHIKESPPDLLLTDVALETPQAGLGLAEEVIPLGLPVILKTANAHPLLYQQAKALRPIAFLVEPFDRFTLQGAIELSGISFKAAIGGYEPENGQSERNLLPDVVFVKSNNVIQKVRLQDILYIHAEGNYSTIVTQQKRIAVKMSLSQMQEMIEIEDFLQVHRNYLVRLREVDSISLSHNELSIHGHTVPISRQKFRDDLLKNVKLLK
jgi:DNA-binding LytR/AlgR family response regulator